MHLAAAPSARHWPAPPFLRSVPAGKYCQLFGIFIIAQTFMVVDGAGIAQGKRRRGRGRGRGGNALTATISGFDCSSSSACVCVGNHLKSNHKLCLKNA